MEALRRKEHELSTKSELLNAMERSLAETTRSMEGESLHKQIAESELSNCKSILTVRDDEIKQLEDDKHRIAQKMEQLQTLFSEQNTQLEASRDEVTSLEHQRQQLTADVDVMSAEMIQLEDKRTALDAEKADILNQLLTANATNINYEEDIALLSKKALRSSEQMETLTYSLSNQEQENKKLSNALSMVEAEKNELVSQLKIDNDAVELRSQLLADANDQIDTLEKDIIVLVEDNRALKSSQQDDRQLLAESEKEMKLVESSMKEKIDLISTLSVQLDEVQTELLSVSSESKTAANRLAQIQSESDSTMDAYTSIREAITALNTMTENGETVDDVISSEMLQDLQTTVSGKNQHLGELLTTLLSFSSSNNEAKQQIGLLEMELKQDKTVFVELQKSLELVTAEKMKLECDIDSFKERENEEKSAKMRERFARLETISKLESMQQQLESIKAKHAESMNVVKERDDELRTLRATIRESKETISRLQIDLSEVNKEKDKLCGHQNNKQKIQLHMLLKKNIEEQTQSLKHMQEQLSKVTLERDQAVDECRRVQQQHHHHQAAAGPGTGPSTTSTTSKKLAAGENNSATVPQMVRRSQVKRTPLADTTTSSDNRIATTGATLHL
jgi:chromosome segregation ATPase